MRVCTSGCTFLNFNRRPMEDERCRILEDTLLFLPPSSPVHAAMPLAARRCVVCALFVLMSLHADAASAGIDHSKKQSPRSRKFGLVVVAEQWRRLLQQQQQPGYPNYPSWPPRFPSPPYSPGKWKLQANKCRCTDIRLKESPSIFWMVTR